MRSFDDKSIPTDFSNIHDGEDSYASLVGARLKVTQISSGSNTAKEGYNTSSSLTSFSSGGQQVVKEKENSKSRVAEGRETRKS